MATEKGVWNLQEVRDKQIQSEWDYTGNIQLWAWGQGEWVGSPVSPGNADLSSPTQIPATYGYAWDLSKTDGKGTQSTGAIQNGQLWVWGRNQSGQLGQGNKTDSQDPIQVGTDNNWASYAVGATTSAAIKTDGTLWVWGANSVGQLGNNEGGPGPGNESWYSSPTQLMSDKTFSTSSDALSVGSYNLLALDNEGSLWGCGGNNNGSLGINIGGPTTNTRRSSPAQIPGTWKQFSSGQTWTMAIKTDGTLWGWGSGQRAAPGNRSSPTQVPQGPGNWAYVSSGTIGNIAVATDGTLWSWGSNSHGQLGHNNKTTKNSPSMIGYSWQWSTTSRPHLGFELAAAIKQDGTLWTWGDNEYGELGHNNVNDGYSSPTQLPGTKWEAITGSGLEGAVAQAENHS